MRILMTYTFSLGTPGGGTVGCLEIARGLRELGANVTLLPVARGPSPGLYGDDDGAIAVRRSRVHALLDSVPMAIGVRRILQDRPVDAVIGWGPEAAFLPRLLRSRGVALCMIAASSSYEQWWNRSTRMRSVKRLTDSWFHARPFRQADVVFALSRFTRNEMAGLIGVKPDRIVVTHWGVDPGFATIARHAGDIRRVLFFGSLAPIKGATDAIEALGMVATGGRRNWSLGVAGWGDDRPLRAAVRRHGLENNVEFLGCLDPARLVQELARSDLAVLPSRAESFGLAIAEAQASGIPVIAYDTAAVPEVVESGVTGTLVPAGRIDLLATAIEDVMADPARAFLMGQAGRDRIRRLFAWKRTAATMLDAIEHVPVRSPAQSAISTMAGSSREGA